MGHKVLLGLVLGILLWSRILSNVATIQIVQASFPVEQLRGTIPVPSASNLDDSDAIALHVRHQQQMAGDTETPLRELTERKRQIKRVKELYARWNAPMAEHAEYIVDVSHEFGIDWRLIPAISIVESSGGRYCFKPYNAFGWGRMGFSGFEESIYTVTKGIAHSYQTDNPHAIAPRYNPVTPVSWANKVSGLMGQI